MGPAGAMISVPLLLVLLGSMASRSLAWGPDGHMITAQVAQALLTADEANQVASLLGGGGGNDTNLGSVATWADDVKHEKQWAWSQQLHFINTPDGQCNFDYDADCKGFDGTPGNCVAGAILNYTSQLLSPKTSDEDPEAIFEALKFVVHFVGDIHQPLHVGWTTDKGGNAIHTEEHWLNDKHANLHMVWDTGIITGLEEDTGLDEAGLAKNLTQDFAAGAMSAAGSKEWGTWCFGGLNASNYSEEEDLDLDLKACLTQVAKESITFACNSAYKDETGKVISNGEELTDDYYKTRVPVVREQLTAGGVRLAQLVKYILQKRAAPTTEEPVQNFPPDCCGDPQCCGHLECCPEEEPVPILVV